MKRILALAFSGALAAIVAACGGGGGSSYYGGVAHELGDGCDYAVGVITSGYSSRATAQHEAYLYCEAGADTLAEGASRDGCDSTSFSDCAAIAAGYNSSTGQCRVVTRASDSFSGVQSSALQACRSGLGSGADCELLVAACSGATGSPFEGYWAPTRTSPPPPGPTPPPPGPTPPPPTPPPPPPPPPQPGQVSLGVVDGCNDGLDIQYKYFEYATWLNGNTAAGQSITGQWPAEGRVYVTTGFNNQSQADLLNCTSGYAVCYGATPYSSTDTRYWGAGIDGSESCTSCCTRCPSSGTESFSWRLTC